MTKVEIVNLALSKLGATLIIRLGDTAIPASHHGNLLYQPTLERILRDFPWSFATREEALPQLPSPLLSEYSYSYALPADYVRIASLPEENSYLRNEDFKRTGKTIHTHRSTVLLKYVHSSVSPDDFDADFQDAFVTLLASELATPLLQSPGLAKSLKEEYLGVSLPKAKTSESRETDSGENHGPFKAIALSPLNRARRQYSGEIYQPYDGVTDPEEGPVPDLDAILEAGLPPIES